MDKMIGVEELAEFFKQRAALFEFFVQPLLVQVFH
jgi:hypothetical protein